MHIGKIVKRWAKLPLIFMIHKLDGIVCSQYLGQQITYDSSTVIGGLLMTVGEFENREMELCKEYIFENSNIIDIGANIGLHSIYFSGLAKNGCIFALEPSLSTFSFLASNIANVSNIVPINIACCDAGGVADFYHTADNAYSSLIDTKRKTVTSIRKVPCMKVDDIVRGLDLTGVDFVKIDVEGLEFEVLHGMTDVISKFRPVIFCEIYKGTHSNQQPEKTVEFLVKKGYRALVICKGRLIDYVEHNDAFFNYLFLPGSQ